MRRIVRKNGIGVIALALVLAGSGGDVARAATRDDGDAVPVASPSASPGVASPAAPASPAASEDPGVVPGAFPPWASPAFEDPQADAAARKITNAQLLALIKGVFTLSPSIVVDPRSQSDAALGRPPVYEGKRSDGKYHIQTNGGLACLHFAPHAETSEADCLGAILAIAADAGAGGPDVERAYDAATDKREFARSLGRALQLENQRETVRSNASVAFMQALPIGESRSSVYRALRERKIVVYNRLFSPGRRAGGGCDYYADKAASAYPTYGEALPEMACGPKFSHVSEDDKVVTVAPRSPSAGTDFDYGFDLACGYTEHVRLDFDGRDRLSAVTASPTHYACL